MTPQQRILLAAGLLVALGGPLAYLAWFSEAGSGQTLGITLVTDGTGAVALPPEAVAARAPELGDALALAAREGSAALQDEDAISRACDLLGERIGRCTGTVEYGGRFFRVEHTVA